MSVIVTERGFVKDQTPAHTGSGVRRVDLCADTDPAQLAQHVAGADLVTIGFASFTDGRGFTLARLLRLQGFAGRLRACGALLPDQFPLARRAGFDEVEIDASRAARQPENQWTSENHLYTYDYQSRLRGRV